MTLLAMDDPDRSNALTPSMVSDFRAALRDVDAGVLVIRAEGTNFCSGGDHRTFAALSRDERRRYLQAIKALYSEVRAQAVPTVACMQGWVIGGGLELVLHCDLLVADHDARFSCPHIAARTRVQETTYSELLARTSSGFARRMILLGEVVTAPQALAAGLVDFASRPTALRATAMSVAENLARQPAEGIDLARRALAGSTGDGEKPPTRTAGESGS